MSDSKQNNRTLERQIEYTIKEWIDRKRYIKIVNEFFFQQRIANASHVIKMIDDNYVKESAKVIFGEDVELTQIQVDELKPVCIDTVLGQMFPYQKE